MANQNDGWEDVSSSDWEDVPSETKKVQSISDNLKSGLSSTADVLGESYKRTMDSGPNSFNSLTGGIQTELAHNAKSIGLERMGVHPLVAEALSTATDPQTVLSSFLVGERVVTAAPGVLKRLESFRASSKARSTVPKLLPSLDISTDVKQGRPVGGAVEATNIIDRKTKDPQVLVNKFMREKDFVIGQVDSLVKENNQPINPQSIVERARLILKDKIKNASSEERVKIKEAALTEAKWIKEQGDFDTVKANDRKRYLYAETEGTQKKQTKGQTVIAQPEVNLVKDAFAQAYKEVVEKVHPDIQKLNSRFAGIENGLKASADLVSAIQKQQPKNILQKVSGYVLGRLSPAQSGAAAVRELPYLMEGGNAVEKYTSKISSLMKKSNKAYVESRLQQLKSGNLLERFIKDKPNSEFFKDLVTKEDMTTYADAQDLIARNKMREVKTQLPGGVSGSDVINVPGSSTINIPPVLESEYTRLKQKYGIPEYGSGPRSVTKEIPKTPKGSLSKENIARLKRRQKYLG